MRIWAPWETAWPAGAALVVLAAAAVASRKHLRPAQPAQAVALFAVALVVRLFVVPAWWDHQYDGHEAEFYDLFVGDRAVNRGGTVLYPAMQWLWWGLGRVLPHDPRVPVAVMALVGAATAPVVAAMSRWLLRDGGPRLPGAPVVAGLFVALHPAHAAWSSSAYNVVLPGLFGAVVLWSGAVVGRSRRPPLAVATLGAAAWALVVATRMEAAVVGLPAALLALGLTAPGDGWSRALRARWALLGPLALGLVLGGFALFPLVYPGEVPGAGERLLALAMHASMLDYWWPHPGRSAVLLLSAVFAAFGLRRAPGPTLALLAGVVATHLLMATFDDLGDRHLLPMVPALAFFWGVGVAAVPLPFGRPVVRRVGQALVAAPLLVGLWHQADRYYASEERYGAWLEGAHAALPRQTVAEARGACGWINEDPRAAATPVASHFNVLDPAEAAALRGPDGCLRWCSDLQDWRWSSRGVADRALRMRRLYDLQPVAVVEETASGYACVVWEVGARRCCDGADQP